MSVARIRAGSLTSLLNKMEDYPLAGTDTVTLWWQYEVGILNWRQFREAISYARVLGLQAELNHNHGFLVKHGDAMIKGPWWIVRGFTYFLRGLGMV